MYRKPALTRFGTFRDLTRGGPVALDLDTAGGYWDTLFHTDPPKSGGGGSTPTTS